jgi:protein-S-isoprenylcysteine O-methyltransferase Ste14
MNAKKDIPHNREHPATFAGILKKAGSLAMGPVLSGIIATSTEDRVLRDALPDYGDYVRNVRFRLVPGIW